jgi:hypothetical protein
MPGNVYFQSNSYFRNRVTNLVGTVEQYVILHVTFVGVQQIVVKYMVVSVFIIVISNKGG